MKKTIILILILILTLTSCGPTEGAPQLRGRILELTILETSGFDNWARCNLKFMDFNNELLEFPNVYIVLNTIPDYYSIYNIFRIEDLGDFAATGRHIYKLIKEER